MSAEARATLVIGEWAEKARWASGPMMADVRSAVDERGADVNEAADDGRTPLMCACSYCVDPDVVGFLLSKGADARAADERGRTALHHLAAQNASKTAASYATALLASGGSPMVPDAAGQTAISEAKKKKNAAVLAVLEAWEPPPPSAETLAAVRSHPWYEPWRREVFGFVDKSFDSDAATVELVGLTAAEDEAEAHDELSALVVDLEEAYRSGSMGGGSYRQCSKVRIGHDKMAGKLSKLGDDQHVILAYCAKAKREGVSKKVQKYNEKSGHRITAAWAIKDA
jgi:hypothetical protein